MRDNKPPNSENHNANGENDKNAEKSVGGTAAEVKTEPDLPDENFDGYMFTFLAHRYNAEDWVSEDPLELVSEEQTGEPVNDAVYKRNLRIKEKYNIEIEMIPSGDERSAIRKAIGAGDDIYDAVVMFNNNVPGIVTANYLTNVEDLPYIDLDKPWWDPAVNSMSIGNKNYLLSGDLLILDNEATNAILFNKDLLADLGMELPYGAAKEGKWTMDKMNGIIKGAAADLDGDGIMTALEDRWGLCVFNDTLHSFLVSGGGALAVKDENDIPYMDFASPKNLAALDKVMNLMYNPEYVLNAQAPPPGGRDSNAFEIYTTGFGDGRILFMWIRMRVVELFRGMEANFGILPMPKADDSQEGYRSAVNPYTGVLLGVPKSAEDLERVSIILEALSAESLYTLQPAYYDVTLQRKLVRDDASRAMLDIIFANKVYDIGAVYSFGNCFMGYIGLYSTYSTDIASYYATNSSAMDSDIQKIVQIFQSNT